MIKRKEQFRKEVRSSMRGGTGDIVIQHIWEPGTELRSPVRMFSKLTLEPGFSIGSHEHGAEEEVFYIVSGTAEYSDNGKTVVLHAGDSSVNGGGESHSIKNIGPDKLEVLAWIGKF